MNSFFDEASEQSIVKATIVEKYFSAWARVITNVQKSHPTMPQKVAYIDLFAGPGRYKDGNISTPLRILTKVIEEQELCNRLVAIFNDKDAESIKSLEQHIRNIPGFDTLKYKPQISNEEVGEQMVKLFESMRLIPTFFFVDPWGYKGLSLKLVNSVIKDWGCDCIFFFNYNRINMGLTNPAVKEHMDALFGSERAEKLRTRLIVLPPGLREMAIVEEISNALKEMGGTYVLPFGFKNAIGNRTSHHLFFVCKNFKGYEIMKEIMAKESSKHDQGVPSFEYNPADKEFPFLFELSRPLDDLAEMLLKDFKGRELSMMDIYNQHNCGKPFIKKNYKDILLRLESENKVECNPPASKRRKNTIADTVLVNFANGA